MLRTIAVAISLITLIIVFSCANKHRKAQSENELPQTERSTKYSISKKLKENEHLPIAGRIALYLKLKSEKPTAYNFENEDELTMYGYGLLWNDQTRDAKEIFELIVSQFPNSSNAYDSLGEAYLALGNMTLALANYERSLQMNPDNFNAEDQIERIKFPEKKPLAPAEKFTKVYTVQEYKEDLDQLGNKLITIHPNALKFITEADFWEAIEKKKAQITEHTTYAEFSWHCNEIIANVNCSHTSNGNFTPEWDMLPVALRFPLEVRLMNDGLFVVDNTNHENEIGIKDQILSINGIQVSELIKDIYKHIPSQGHIKTYKRHKFNAWASGMIAYALNFPESYEVIVKGKVDGIPLNGAVKEQENFQEPFKKPCPEELCLEFFEDTKSVILTISTFNYYPWNNLNVFQDFIDKSFKEINKKGVQNLIIDLRFNGGGSPESSIHLLKYLVDKPFTYFIDLENPQRNNEHVPFDKPFKGQCYFLIDGKGNSTTGHFMALVRELKLGTVIGEELGSNQFCTAGQTVLRLTNTKMNYYVANTTSIVHTKGFSEARGILPDYHITQGIDDYLNNRDTVRQFALKTIEKEWKSTR